MPLSPDQIQRYARQLVLPEIGGPGLAKLRKARVSIVGIGGLGGPAAMYLAAAGLGHIRLIDHDSVSLSDLQRQIQFDTTNLGDKKTNASARRLNALNPDCHIETISKRLTPGNASTLLESSNIVLDGSDNFETRFAVNQACVTSKLPLVSGAVGRWQAQLALFDQSDPNAPCYQCLVAAPPPQTQDCATLGVAGPLTGIVGAHMALEALKAITGAGRTLSARLWLFDALTGDSRILTLRKDPECPICS